ncbi:alpha/beta fold hydrolase [Marinactinospora thermotolerans]|uniref:Lysophospholipase n=1 Tax=Marinactinospora thermotolerans DSM 45154 TaxID=1122192 RepID=A0A1T4PQV6_9ACTN|nr:alpha/beta fold hydrolase [Marinactinospora thermotolerans]SJZ93607.1 Lysophospholipase [Marinactinospora thermotolerans DSM 45154]
MSTYRQPGTVLTDHVFSVPLDHGAPDGERIELYAREVVAAERAEDDLPWLLYFQGGPGIGSPRPIGRQDWLDRALRDYRVLLLDQRGTGRSTPANRATLARFADPRDQAAYLAHFRADSIVLDAELIRRELIGDAPWSVLGQSFGGFCAVTYLSFAPEGLREVFITGGLPGLSATPDDVYRATYRRVEEKNDAHYRRYPHDVERVRELAAHLRDHDVRLPNGARFTVEALQALGRMLGSGSGSHALHYLIEDASADGTSRPSDGFLAQAEAHLSFAATPLYALLHEPCYAQGHGATAWSAQRIRAEFPRFDADTALAQGEPVLFTGEMIYPWMFEADPVLRPLREAAELIAARETWPRLYDPARLRANEVPVAAAVYHDDMYVDRDLSLETARTVNGLRAWVTNEYEHDGLRVSGGAVLDRLMAMVHGRV